MREITPPNSESGDWEALEIDFVHAKITGKDFELFGLNTVLENWVGTRRRYKNKKDGSIVFREYDFFIKGTVLKFWGFEEDLKEGGGQVALLDAGKWYLKESGDEFCLIVDTNRDGKIVSIKIRFSNKNRTIEVIRTALKT